MAQYDGSIRINTTINTKNASSQMMALENRMVKAADKIADLRAKMDSLKNTQAPTAAFNELSAEIKKAETEYSKLQSELAKPGKPTEKYKILQSDLRAAEKELEKLVAQQTAMENMGIPQSGGAFDRFNEKVSDAALRVEELKEKMYLMESSGKAFNPRVSTEQLEAAKQKVEDLKQKMEDLKASGGAVTSGVETEEYTRLSQQLQYAQNDMAILNQRHKELEQRQAKNKNGYKRLGKAARDGAKVASKATQSMSNALKLGFKNILKYGLGIRSFYVLVNKIRTGIKEGFGNLYKEAEGFKAASDNLKASLLTLKNSFAAAFRPLVEAAIPYIQKLVDYLSLFLDKLGQLMAAIAGQKTYTRAIRQTADALEDAKKAEEEYLSPLDEINKYKSPSGEESSGKPMFEEVPIDENLSSVFEKIAEYGQRLKEIFSQGFWDGLGDWEYRWENIKSSIDSVKNNLTDIWTSPEVLSAVERYMNHFTYMIGNLAGSATSIGLTIATNLFGGISKYIDQNKDKIKNFIISMLDISAEIMNLVSKFSESIAYIFESFASEDAQQLTANIIGIFNDSIMGILEISGKLARDVLNIFVQPFIDNKEEFRDALEGFLGVFSDVTGTIKEGIDETFSEFNQMYDEHFKPFFDSVATGLSDTTKKFMEFWNGNVQPILDEWAKKFDKLWKEHLQPVFSKLSEMLGAFADMLKVVWETYLKPLIDWIIVNVLPVILPIIDDIVKAAFGIFGAIGDIVGGIIDVITGIITFLTGVFTGDWEKAWDGIVKIFDGIWGQIKGIANLIITLVEGLANGVINGVNNIIRSLNGLSFDIPDWLPPEFGGGTKFGFNIPEIPKASIPRLATGTVVPPNREFLAVLGDNKREPEIVSPVSAMKEAFREAILEMGGVGNSGTIVIKQYLDGKQVAEAVVKEGKVQQMSSGNNMFMLGNM